MSLIHPTFASTPPVTQEKGGVLVQRTTLDSKKILSRHNRRAAKGGNHTAECYLRCAAFAPAVPPADSPRSCRPLALVSLLSLPLRPFSHGGGGTVLPEKVRTRISSHFLYSAHAPRGLRSRTTPYARISQFQGWNVELCIMERNHL